MNKNIIHIALGKANPERPNGVNKVVNSLVIHQVSNGFSAEFWGISFSKEHNYPKRNYRTRLFMDYRNKFRLDPTLKRALKKCNSNETIVHIHGAFIPQFYSLARILKKMNIPYFFTPHGSYNMQALIKSKWLKLMYMRFFENRLVNGAKGIQLLGASEAIGTKKYFKNTLFLIPNGQEVYDITPHTQDFTDTVRLGFIGRIDIKTKGLDLLLAGIKLASERIDLKLEIVGDGGEIDALKEQVNSLGLNDHVIFLGGRYGEDKFATIKTWDALCLNSRNEGLPGVVLEAASMGIPSIVSTATNMGEYVHKHKAGWVLKSNDAFGLAHAFEELSDTLKRGEINTYRTAALTMIREEFDWNKIAKQLVAAYA